MEIKFKKLFPNAAAPAKATYGSAAFDLTATSKEFLGNGLVKMHTGIAVEIPEGYVGLVFPRSSICKQNVSLSNSVGVIDSDYRGEITAVFRNEGNGVCGYLSGDRIVQLMIVALPFVTFAEVDELSETARGTGGYGSTGR